MNLARLNHILIPETKEARDRFRGSFAGKLFGPLLWFFFSLTDEGRFLAVFTLLVGGAGLEVPINPIHLLFGLLVGLLAASIALRRSFPLPQVSLEVVAPRRVTVDEEAVFTLRLANGGGRAHGPIRVEGPFLPWDGAWTGPPPGVPALAPAESVTVQARARFVQRGEHHLEPFGAAALVPFALAQGPRVESPSVLFLVVPRAAEVRGLQLQGGRRLQPGGVALASTTGEARELSGLRPYRPGDPVRDLSARGWAKRGEPVVREWQQEYFTRVGVVLDTDGTVADERRREAAISLAAGVVRELTRGEALIDVLVAGDAVHPLTVGRSLGFLEQVLDHLACVREGPALVVPTLLQRLEPFLPRLSSIVIVALADDPARRALAEELRRRGIEVRLLLVGVKPSGPGATEVPLELLQKRLPVVL